MKRLLMAALALLVSSPVPARVTVIPLDGWSGGWCGCLVGSRV